MSSKATAPLLLFILLGAMLALALFSDEQPQTLRPATEVQGQGSEPDLHGSELAARSQLAKVAGNGLSIEAVNAEGMRLSQTHLALEGRDGDHVVAQDLTEEFLTLAEQDLDDVGAAILSHEGYHPRALDLEVLLRARHLRVVLDRGEELQVLVTDPWGNPIEGVTCVASNSFVSRQHARLVLSKPDTPWYCFLGDRLTQWQKTDVEGKATIAGLAKGGFGFAVVHPEYVVAKLDMRDETLPTFVHAHLSQPGVMLANFDPEFAVVSWSVKTPRSMKVPAHGGAGVRGLLLDYSTKFPGTIRSVGLPAKPGAYSMGLATICFARYGWQEIPIPYRKYREDLEPLMLRPDPSQVSSMGSALVSFKSPSGDLEFSLEQLGWYEICTVEKEARRRLNWNKRLPIGLDQPVPIPYGDYEINSGGDPWKLDAFGDSVSFTVDKEGVTEVAIQVSADYFPVRFNVSDEKGRALDAGWIRMRVNDNWCAANYKKQLSGARLLSEEGRRDYSVKVQGYEKVEGIVDVRSGKEAVVDVVCRLERLR